MSRRLSTISQQDKELAEYRQRLRHSAAHIMADAVLQLFPDAKLSIGPPTEDGFYYDFDVSRPFTPEDLLKIEELMRQRVNEALPFQREEIGREDAKIMFGHQPYKLELIDAIPPDEPISIYRHGNFADLCEGPHVSSTGEVEHFKLLNVAGAYWRGDERNPMLQRIYGTAFESAEALEQHLKRLEEAEHRDHRKLGRQLGLFLFDPVAPASPFFLPKGATVYNLMIAFIRKLYGRYGYQEVITPQIFLTDLWKRSGHYDLYRENMFFIMADEREFGVKPMNCPGHCLMYASQLHSYRELPIRYADFGRLHRYERSGVTHGLTRVRSLSQDDAHIFCRIDQVQGEVNSLMQMMRQVYEVFGLGEPRITLSLRPEKRGGTDEMWDRAVSILNNALEQSGFEYTPMPGEGAFYGPKIDVFMRDAIGRDWQLTTIQLDLFMPERFGLEYVAEDGSLQRPVMIHRAILGSLERFFGVLIEHNAGAFPFWIAPVQVVLVPIADRHVEYANKVAQQLKDRSFRVEVDARNERMNLKIREAQLQKVPYVLVVGDREMERGAVAVRDREKGDLGPKSMEELLQLFNEQQTK